MIHNRFRTLKFAQHSKNKFCRTIYMNHFYSCGGFVFNPKILISGSETRGKLTSCLNFEILRFGSSVGCRRNAACPHFEILKASINHPKHMCYFGAVVEEKR